jgi:hypothetical protein
MSEAPVQFLRGSIAAWEADAASPTPTVPLNGQQVIGFAPDGSVDVRIGDGVATWPTMARVGASSGALSARLDRAGVDAKDRGAIGNGIADDTAVIQGLLDNYDTVILPPGTYGISAMLRLKSGNRLIGLDRKKSIIKALPTMANNITLVGSANTRTDGVEHTTYVTDIVIANLTVDGNGHARAFTVDNATHGSCIRLSTVRDALVEGVTAINGYLHCIDVCASQYEPSWPAGSDGDVNYVVPGPSQRVIIRDCYAADSVRDDPITCHDSSDILIERCVVERTIPLGSGDQHGIEVDEGCYRVAVTDCAVYDHNAGFQVKGHTNTTPSRDVVLTRCRAFRCRTSFHIYHANPSTLPVGKVSWAKNVALIDCESIDPELKSVEPSDTAVEGVSVSGYRNVLIRNMVLRGGSGPYANDVVLDFGCDDVVIDGLYAINVCPTDTGTGRALITTASAYGQGSNRVTLRNIIVEGAMGIPVFRATAATTNVEIDGLTGQGSTGPMIYLGTLKGGDAISRLVNVGYTSEIQLAAPAAVAGTYSGLQIRPGYDLIKFGTGSPASAVAAPPGTIYVRTDGTTSATRYLKETGTGTSGWVSIT